MEVGHMRQHRVKMQEAMVTFWFKLLIDQIMKPRSSKSSCLSVREGINGRVGTRC